MPKTVEQIKQEIQADIDKLVANFKEYQKGGFKLGEVVHWVFEAGTSLIEAVEAVQDANGPEKKEVVISSIKYIYKQVDPNIPWIPEPFETMLENLLLDYALDAFTDTLVGAFNNKGVFTHSD